VRRPFVQQRVGARERTVAADADQRIDSAYSEVLGCVSSAGVGAELGASRGADHGAATRENATNTAPFQLIDLSVHHATEAVFDGEHTRPALLRHTCTRTHCGIHTTGIASTCENTDS
jgi:hypothetical protein